MKRLYTTALMLLTSIIAFAQVPGDTIVVRSFNYTQTYGINQWSPGIRDTIIDFPNDTSLQFEKVIMLYNIRCKDGNISPPISGQTDIGCGEWDASCSSYITDSTHVDSTLNTTGNYNISGFSGTTYYYSTTATNNYVRHFQKLVTVDSIVSETQGVIGSGTLGINHTLDASSPDAKSQYLFTQAELNAAGLDTGDIHGLIVHCLNAGGATDFLRVRLKHTTKTELSAISPDLAGFTEVFFHNTSFVNGDNRIQFYTPFTWDGISNIIVEFSFSNSSAASAIQLKGSGNTDTLGLYCSQDYAFYFNGGNYLQATSYKGISGNTSRTVEAWINTTVANKEICSWGTNNAGEKWVFRVNDNGTVRTEVNGGYVYGTTAVDDGLWHHVAVVYSGTDITDALLYVDGALESYGGTLGEPINTNTSNGINLRISRGINDRYFVGDIDEVRVWSTALTASDLQDWMYRTLDTTHPAYANLEVYYRLNEGSGVSINDNTPYQRNATAINGAAWTKLKGLDLNKAFNETTERPNVKFLQGNYLLTILNDTVYDTIANVPNQVTTRVIVPKWGTMEDDSIAVIATNTYWPANGYEYIFDANGNKIDSTYITADGSITITQLPYYKRFPAKYEIMSFVTPYGINLDLGINGKTWTFDVSDFMPILKGKKRMTIERGGQWMEDMDIRFLFIVGTPPRDVHEINQLWRVESKSYTNIQSDQSYEPREVYLDANSKAFKIRAAISGHGQEGEFIPRDHYIDVENGSNIYIWTVWKECADNPVYPQGGTWIYDRAGWCPGAATDIQEFDITQDVTAGQTARIDYGLGTTSGTSNYIVNAQLVSYGNPNFTLDASIADIMAPTDKVEYSRNNFICNNPKIVLQNTGSTPLTSATIEYWVNGATQKQTYNWTGYLLFLEKEEVTLPSPNSLWTGVTQMNNTFHVELMSPNGSNDEYIYNNSYASHFTIPDVLPSGFILWFYTNNAAYESKYQVFDEFGNKVFERTGMSNTTLYKDTFNLGLGCYTLKVLDTDDDGIDFWANNDGAGYIQIRRSNGTPIKVLEPDFGHSIVYHFTVDFPLTFEELQQKPEVSVFPNPVKDQFFVEAIDIEQAIIRVFDISGKEIILPVTHTAGRISFQTSNLSQGLYFLQINFKGRSITRKLEVD